MLSKRGGFPLKSNSHTSADLEEEARVTQRAIYRAVKSLPILFAVSSDIHVESLLVSPPAWLLQGRQYDLTHMPAYTGMDQHRHGQTNRGIRQHGHWCSYKSNMDLGTDTPEHNSIKNPGAEAVGMEGRRGGRLPLSDLGPWTLHRVTVPLHSVLLKQHPPLQSLSSWAILST